MFSLNRLSPHNIESRKNGYPQFVTWYHVCNINRFSVISWGGFTLAILTWQFWGTIAVSLPYLRTFLFDPFPVHSRSMEHLSHRQCCYFGRCPHRDCHKSWIFVLGWNSRQWYQVLLRIDWCKGRCRISRWCWTIFEVLFHRGNCKQPVYVPRMWSWWQLWWCIKQSYLASYCSWVYFMFQKCFKHPMGLLYVSKMFPTSHGFTLCFKNVSNIPRVYFMFQKCFKHPI